MFAFDCCVPRRLFALVAMAEAKRRVYPETSFCSRSNGGIKPTPAESGVFLLSEHAGKQIDDNAKGRRFAPFCSRSMRGSKSPTTSGGVFLRLEQWRKAINPTGPAGDVISLANHAGQHTTRAAETQRQLHQKCCPPPCRRPNPFPGFFSWIFPRFFCTFPKDHVHRIEVAASTELDTSRRPLPPSRVMEAPYREGPDRGSAQTESRVMILKFSSSGILGKFGSAHHDSPRGKGADALGKGEGKFGEDAATKWPTLHRVKPSLSKSVRNLLQKISWIFSGFFSLFFGRFFVRFFPR